MSLLVSINFGIYLVLSPSHAYNTFRLAYIYFGEIISCTKFTKINGKPIFQALQYSYIELSTKLFGVRSPSAAVATYYYKDKGHTHIQCKLESVTGSVLLMLVSLHILIYIYFRLVDIPIQLSFVLAWQLRDARQRSCRLTFHQSSSPETRKRRTRSHQRHSRGHHSSTEEVGALTRAHFLSAPHRTRRPATRPHLHLLQQHHTRWLRGPDVVPPFLQLSHRPGRSHT